MITYNEREKSFLLTGKGYSYAFFVNGVNTLQHLYYGAELFPVDTAGLIKGSKAQSPNPDNRCYQIHFNDMPTEFGFFGRGDFHDPSVLASRADGTCASQLEYLSHEIYEGAPVLTGMPHARKGDLTLAVTLQDVCSDLQVVLNYTVSEDSAVLVRNALFKNTGKQAMTLQKAFSFSFDLPRGDYSRMSLYGRWASERNVAVSPVPQGISRIQTVRAGSSHSTNPFMAIMKDGCTEDSGECYSVNLCYSGSFALTTEWAADQTLRVQGGINDFNFSWKLGAGEQFVAPQAFLNYSNGGLGRLSREYVDFLREYVIIPQHVYATRPIVINNWEATYFDFNNEKLFPIIDAAAELGVDTFVLDDGWFGKRDDDWSGLGDWYVNEKKLEGGLNTVINYVKNKGMKFGLWFEPEMVNPDSDLYRAHPDYAVQMPNIKAVESRQQYILDFSRKEVVDCIYEQVSKILREHDIAYVKWDMNRYMTENFTPSLPADRQGEFQHRYMLGVYDLAERLTGEFKDVLFEGCASGGGRFDAGMFYYFSQYWTSDDTDAYERTKIQWGSSYMAPLSEMSSHVSACPNHQTGRVTPIQSRGAVASLGPMGYELNLAILSDEEKSVVKEQVKNYRQIADLILKGDLYRYLTTQTDNFFCVGVIAKDKSSGYVVGMRDHGIPCEPKQYVCLKGFAPDKVYEIPELGVTASGKALGEKGILIPSQNDYCSWTWHVNERK